MATPAQCRANTKKGTRCTAFAVKGSEFCLTHAPERAKERAARNRRGGLARVIPKVAGDAIEVASMTDVLGLVNAVILDTWQLENSAPRSRALLAAAELAIKAMQIGELEERVARLEQLITEGKG